MFTVTAANPLATTAIPCSGSAPDRSHRPTSTRRPWKGGLLALIALCCIGPSYALPTWFDATARNGIKPGLPDFYQHQYYVADPTDTWQSRRPDAVNYPQLAHTSGWCRETAITDVLAYRDTNSFSGVVRPGTVKTGATNWQPASKQTILDIRGALKGTGLGQYLKDRYAADQAAGGAKQWKTGLVFNQYVIDKSNGEVKIGGKTLRKNAASGGKAAVSAFDAAATMLLNGQDVLLKFRKDPAVTYSDTLWWDNYHYVALAGVGLKKHRFYFADPDSNKGNRSADPTYKPGSALDAKSGDAGWVSHVFDPSKTGLARYGFVDAKSGVAVDPIKTPFTWVSYKDGKIEKLRVSGPTEIVWAKGADANVDARKFGAADNAVPFPVAPDPGKPASFDRYYGTLEIDNSTVDRGFKVAASDDKDGNIGAGGRFSGLQIAAIETIGPKGIRELDPVKGVKGLKTPIQLLSALPGTIDRFQIVFDDDNMALYSADIDDALFTSTNGGQWRGIYLAPGGDDALGNPIAGGGWSFVLETGVPLPAIDLTTSLPLDFLPAFVETANPLTRYALLQHVGQVPNSGLDDLWNIQWIGLDETFFGDQLRRPVSIPPPAPWLLLVAGLVLLVSPRPRRPSRQG